MKLTPILGSFLCLGLLTLGCSSSETDSAINDFEKIVDKGISVSKGMSKDEMKKSPEMLALRDEFKAATMKVESLKEKFTPEQKTRLEAIVARAKASAEE